MYERRVWMFVYKCVYIVYEYYSKSIIRSYFPLEEFQKEKLHLHFQKLKKNFEFNKFPVFNIVAWLPL